MSETPNMLLPFPVDTDKIAKGAFNIEELAEQIEADILINAKAATDPYTSYPKGVSIMASGNAGWPYSTGEVITFKIKAGSFVTQFFVWRTSVTTRQQVMVRYGYSNSSGTATWTDWQSIVASGEAQKVATGRSVVPGKTNGFATLTVTLPSGLFNGTPAVVLQMQTSSSPNIGYSLGTASSTSFQIVVDRPSGTDTTIFWIAASNYA